jgi:hypothetical protein
MLPIVISISDIPEVNPLQVITYLARTPLTKARKGGLKDTTVDDLLVSLLTVLSPLIRTNAR